MFSFFIVLFHMFLLSFFLFVKKTDKRNEMLWTRNWLLPWRCNVNFLEPTKKRKTTTSNPFGNGKYSWLLLMRLGNGCACMSVYVCVAILLRYHSCTSSCLTGYTHTHTSTHCDCLQQNGVIKIKTLTHIHT